MKLVDCSEFLLNSIHEKEKYRTNEPGKIFTHQLNSDTKNVVQGQSIKSTSLLEGSFLYKFYLSGSIIQLISAEFRSMRLRAR